MFGSLKKKLKESITGLAKKVKEEPKEEKPVKVRKPTEKKTLEKKKIKPIKKAKKPEKVIESPKEVLEEKEEIVEAVKDEQPLEPEHALEEVTTEPEPPVEEPVQEEKKSRFGLGKIKERITEKTLSDEDIEEFFSAYETGLLQSNIALEVVDHIKQRMKEQFAGKPIKRSGAEERIKNAFKTALLEIVDQGDVDILKLAKEGDGKPCFVFLGFNGSGKTTSLAKLGQYLMNKKKSVVFAAGDSFRAASIEQLQHHGDKLGVKVIKHDYGADSAAVIFDAVKYVEGHGVDIALADTAGRMHSDKNLMDELKKVIRVNNPRLKILVIDSLTGNDAVEQARKFHEAVGVDAIIMGKADVNEKGGSILSVCYAIKKPILFLGTGQGYNDLERFGPKKFVDDLFK